MKINDIIQETTSAGAIASVATPLGKVIKRPNPSVYAKKKKVQEGGPEHQHSEELAKYEELLKRHDWTYNYSDDQRAWSKGNKEADEIQRMKRTLSGLGLASVASELYAKYKDN